MKNNKLILFVLFIILLPLSKAFANPIAEHSESPLMYVLPLIAEVALTVLIVKRFGFSTFRLGLILVFLNAITYSTFLYVSALLEPKYGTGLTVLLGELLVIIFEGFVLFYIAKLHWIRKSPSKRLSLGNAIFATTIGNLFSLILPIFFLIFSRLTSFILFELFRLHSSLVLILTLLVVLLILVYLKKKYTKKPMSFKGKLVLIGCFGFAFIFAGYIFLFHFSTLISTKGDKSITTYKRICNISDEEATSRAQELLKKLNIKYSTVPIVEDMTLSNIGYPGMRELKDVRFEYPNGKMKSRFYVGCISGEVEDFWNFEGKKKSKTGNISNRVIDYQGVIEATAERLSMPSDMVFEKMEKDRRENIWKGIYIRKIDGYRYEWDSSTIGVWENTGEIAIYKKIYFGKSCPTDINISKEEAMSTAMNIFNEYVFGTVKKKVNELYDTRIELLIIQPDRPNYLSLHESKQLPIEERDSRLAWVIKIFFTGGIRYDSKNSTGKPNDDERDKLASLNFERMRLMREFGNPIQSLEVRIDAVNGEILYVSDSNPQKYFKRWILPKF